MICKVRQTHFNCPTGICYRCAWDYSWLIAILLWFYKIMHCNRKLVFLLKLTWKSWLGRVDLNCWLVLEMLTCLEIFDLLWNFCLVLEMLTCLEIFFLTFSVVFACLGLCLHEVFACLGLCLQEAFACGGFCLWFPIEFAILFLKEVKNIKT